ncbi:MAG: biopolymer transporter ExbD [Candidatus Didemnitutus sp.]|nr:biopolymer transporter ExbD [Candidatus Didemnitutus sp.]
MARTFKRPRQSQPISDLNVTNLIDVAFTLLIIFMIATPLIQQEQTIPVNLPVESKSQQAKPDPDTKFETITIKADGTCLLGDRSVPLARMRTALAPYAAEAKPPVFRIRMDAKASAQQFISVMDALKQNNLSKVTFDTQTGS